MRCKVATKDNSLERPEHRLGVSSGQEDPAARDAEPVRDDLARWAQALLALITGGQLRPQTRETIRPNGLASLDSLSKTTSAAL